jgi:hypothetical protein
MGWWLGLAPATLEFWVRNEPGKTGRHPVFKLYVLSQEVFTDSACASPTSGMIVEMLVEGVFLVSGVVKTVFFAFQKKSKRVF